MDCKYYKPNKFHNSQGICQKILGGAWKASLQICEQWKLNDKEDDNKPIQEKYTEDNKKKSIWEK